MHRVVIGRSLLRRNKGTFTPFASAEVKSRPAPTPVAGVESEPLSPEEKDVLAQNLTMFPRRQIGHPDFITIATVTGGVIAYLDAKHTWTAKTVLETLQKNKEIGDGFKLMSNLGSDDVIPDETVLHAGAMYAVKPPSSESAHGTKSRGMPLLAIGAFISAVIAFIINVVIPDPDEATATDSAPVRLARLFVRREAESFPTLPPPLEAKSTARNMVFDRVGRVQRRIVPTWSTLYVPEDHADTATIARAIAYRDATSKLEVDPSGSRIAYGSV